MEWGETICRHCDYGRGNECWLPRDNDPDPQLMRCETLVIGQAEQVAAAAWRETEDPTDPLSRLWDPTVIALCASAWVVVAMAAIGLATVLRWMWR